MSTPPDPFDRPAREGVQLVLRMKPPWAFVDEVRRFVESFCACAGSMSEHRDAQLAVAVHELMQNAIPRSGGEHLELQLDVDPAGDRVTVAVTRKEPPDPVVSSSMFRT